MNAKEALLKAIEQAPESVVEDLLDFLQDLKRKQAQSDLEDHEDLEDSRAALEEAKREGTTSLADLKQELGL